MVWTSIKAKAPARPAPAPERPQVAPQQQTNRPADQGQAGSSMPTPPRTNPSPSAPPWVSQLSHLVCDAALPSLYPARIVHVSW